RDEVEVGDDGPRLRLLVLVPLLEYEDRVHAVGRHHPGDDPKRGLGRAADETVAHRVPDRPGLEGCRRLVAPLLYIHHAVIVPAPGGVRLGGNSGPAGRSRACSGGLAGRGRPFYAPTGRLLYMPIAW